MMKSGLSADSRKNGEVVQPPVHAGSRPLVRLLVQAIRGYQWGISSVLSPSCRYWPSCSDYALEALQLHGAVKGGWLSVRRLCRCHPWGGQGVDPVPPVVSGRHRDGR